MIKNPLYIYRGYKEYKMGIFSAVAKVATRVVKAVTKSVSGSAAKTVSKKSGSIWAGAKSSPKALGDGKGLANRAVNKLTNTAAKPSFWKSIGNAVSNVLKPITKYAPKALKVGAKFAKRIPIIGTAVTIAVEAPNIYKGYKKEGWTGAMKQVGGAGVELGCMAAGAAIGSIVPGLGTGIGAVVGGLVGWGIRAFTFPEPDDDEEVTKPKSDEKTKEQAPKKEVKPAETKESKANQKPNKPEVKKPVEKPSTPVNTPVANDDVIPDNGDKTSGKVEKPSTTDDTKVSDEEKDETTTNTTPKSSYTDDEIERLMALGMSRKQIIQLVENGFSYRDVEMALITSLLEESQGTANPFATENNSQKSLKLVG